MVRHVFFNNHTNGTSSGKNNGGLAALPSGTKAALVYGISTDTDNQDNYTVTLPTGMIAYHPGTSHDVSVFDVSGQTAANGYYLYDFSETCGISVGAYNSATADSSWWYKGGTLSSLPHDTQEPTQIGIAPMAACDYKAGETVTISVIFDEIVADAGGAAISGTNLTGSWSCCGGAGSNVLTFTGQISQDCTDQTILNGIILNGTPIDMAN
jgi:hypothetical protein